MAHYTLPSRSSRSLINTIACRTPGKGLWLLHLVVKNFEIQDAEVQDFELRMLIDHSLQSQDFGLRHTDIHDFEIRDSELCQLEEMDGSCERFGRADQQIQGNLWNKKAKRELRRHDYACAVDRYRSARSSVPDDVGKHRGAVPPIARSAPP
ncbi:hypothetical protein M514_23836 [Trichuris suis]|uniref:Uncharacterized protein n=1 Tax=Trichuris suis TaxID=68888 RepID=A0A085N3E2_9BILA|nr:hypothetical protein M514_23836 [Trichuris suis]